MKPNRELCFYGYLRLCIRLEMNGCSLRTNRNKAISYPAPIACMWEIIPGKQLPDIVTLAGNPAVDAPLHVHQQRVSAKHVTEVAKAVRVSILNGLFPSTTSRGPG